MASRLNICVTIALASWEHGNGAQGRDYAPIAGRIRERRDKVKLWNGCHIHILISKKPVDKERLKLLSEGTGHLRKNPVRKPKSNTDPRD